VIRFARLVAAVAAGATLVACSGGSPVVDGPTTTDARGSTSTTADGDGTTSTTADGTSTVPAPCPPERPAAALPDTPISRLDLDDDGVEETWAVVATGASATVYGLFKVDGCELVEVTVGGTPAEFPVGGTVVNQAGLFCTDSGAVAVATATSEDGVTYSGVRTDYRLEGTALVQQSSAPLELSTGDPSFPDLAAFRC
jgi:hypothetical protein